ncbi:MAG TPA: hypothetical protein VFO79_17455, partial [Xanthomonadales bacterium]|nr:hypothetical protein [Xanthomonadales bacterium]
MARTRPPKALPSRNHQGAAWLKAGTLAHARAANPLSVPAARALVAGAESTNRKDRLRVAQWLLARAEALFHHVAYMPEQTPQGAVVPAAWRAVRSYRGVLLQRAAHGASPAELDHAVGIGVRMLLRTIARELTDATDPDAAELIELARAKALRAVLTATDF